MVYDHAMNDFAHTVDSSLVGALEVLLFLLDTAEAHIAEHELAPEELLEAQLFADMFPFWRQVASACNVARRTVDRLGGKEIHDPPRPQPNLATLRTHVHMTIAYVGDVDRAAVEATAVASLTAKLGKQPVELTGSTYLSNFALPNVLFHVVTAYNILRHRGVAVGKHGYLGPMISRAAL